MADDMPYDRIRELVRRGDDIVDQEQLRAAAAWRESFEKAKAQCLAGDCHRRDCDDGSRCPFARAKR